MPGFDVKSIKDRRELLLWAEKYLELVQPIIEHPFCDKVTKARLTARADRVQTALKEAKSADANYEFLAGLDDIRLEL